MLRLQQHAAHHRSPSAWVRHIHERTTSEHENVFGAYQGRETRPNAKLRPSGEDTRELGLLLTPLDEDHVLSNVIQIRLSFCPCEGALFRASNAPREQPPRCAPDGLRVPGSGRRQESLPGLSELSHLQESLLMPQPHLLRHAWVGPWTKAPARLQRGAWRLGSMQSHRRVTVLSCGTKNIVKSAAGDSD